MERTVTVVMARQMEKVPSDPGVLPNPPCGGCPSHLNVFLSGLDASDGKLAFAIVEVASLSRSSAAQSQTVSALSRVRHQWFVPFIRVRLRLNPESLGT
jgi:hypothetical protein